MEGGGECMVAVVQGLQDAGLAVTLMGGRRERKRPIVNGVKQMGHLTHAKSTAETSTNGLPIISVDTSAQVCDDRYTSSYRIAHCRARPSSPPLDAAEFPPQRAEPCRTLGNFELGGVGSCEARPAVKATRSPHSLRDNFTSVDRGLATNSQACRCTETFVHSLRKYPSISPNRSISSDLVQRLLAYTQAKNFSKSSYHSRSLRSLRNKNLDSSKDSATKAKMTKSVQTYTRAKNKKEMVAKVKEKDKDGRSSNDNNKDGRTSPKTVRSRSPQNESRNLRHNSSLINATYDYLKASSRRVTSRAADVRYLTDVTRCLRDTLRQICDDTPVAVFQMCPNIQNRYSQHRRDHHRRGNGVEMSSDSNNVEAQVSSSMVSTGVPVMSSCEAISGTYEKNCPSRPKFCCYCRKPMPCACKSSIAQLQRLPFSKESMESKSYTRFSRDLSMESANYPKKVDEAVMNWLQEIPVYSNENSEDKATREDMARNLVEKLTKLKGDPNFEEKANAEIIECINKMPMWYPGNKSDHNMFKEQIAANLVGKVVDLTKEKDKFENEINKWVESLNLKRINSQDQIVDKRSIVDNLVNRLKPLALNPPADLKKALKDEIVEVLEDLPIKADGDKKGLINKLANNLANQLYSIPAKDIPKRLSVNLEEEFQKQIWEWLQEIPEFSNASSSSLSKNQNLVESFAKNLRRIQAQSADGTDTQEQMQNAINEWLEDNAGKRGTLDGRTKNKLAEKLLAKLIDVSEKAAKHKSMESDKDHENMVREILNWLNDIPELSGDNKLESRKMVQSLAKKLVELRTQGKDESELEKEILNWLTTSFENKGERLDVSNQKNLIKKLMGKIKDMPIAQNEDNLIKEILNCLEDIPNFEISFGENKKLIEQLAKKIQEFRLQSNGQVDQDEIKKEITEWLTDVDESSGAKLSSAAKSQLVKKLMDIAAVPKQRRRWNKQEDPVKVMNSLKEEVGHILDKSEAQFENRDNVESVLTDILADQIMRGENERQTKNRLISALEDSNIPHEESEEIANELTQMAKEMSLLYKTQDSTLFSDRKTLEISPVEKEVFQESAQREILDFIDEISGETSPAFKKKFKEAAQELAERVGDIMSDKKITPSDKREQIENEVSKYLKDLSIQTDIPIEEQSSQLTDRLQNLAFKTSTPKRSSFDKEISFRPRRDSKCQTISRIDDISPIMQTQAPNKEERQYMGRIEGIIDGWMSNLPINLDSDEGKDFKDVMIKDLAGDIIDRQKYLQLNPDANTSDEEELEHLKYQVFRWLNKLPDVRNLIPFIAKTDELMDRIKGVAVPQLIKSSERRSSKETKESSVQHLSKDLANLQSEISKWFKAVPQKYVLSKDKKAQDEMIKDLAEQINQFQTDNTLTDPVFQEIVTEWLEKNLKGVNEKYVTSLTEGLKGVLVNKDLMSLDQKPQSRKLSINADGIKAAILKWSQKLPFQSGKSIEHAKSHVDNFSTKVKKVVGNTHPDNLDDIKDNLETEIKEFLNKLPLHKNKIKDDHVQELGNKLHGMVSSKSSPIEPEHMITDGIHSKSGFKKAADVLYDNIEDWCESLPIPEGKTPEEQEKVKTLKQSVASRLINIIGDLNMKPELFKDDSLYDDILSDEIDNLLQTLPPSEELENNLPALKENLIAKVKEAKQKTQIELAGQAYKQQLCDAISRTLPSTNTLPTEEQAPFEVLKDNLADAYIELHYAAGNEEIKSKLKNKISDEINQFCNDYLKRYPSSPVDPSKLNRELFNVLQKVPIPKDETIKSQVEQVRIKDDINDWLKELPLKDETPSEQLQRNKIVSLLAKGLHDIEKEKENNPEMNVEDQMQNEIKKWIKKLPIRPTEDYNVEQMVEKLTTKLKNSEESRKFSVTHIRRSADLTEDERQCPYYSKFARPKPPLPPCKSCLSQYAPPFPASTLSTEDRAHLQRIRERNQQKELSFKSINPRCNCKDASVSPIPIDAGSQTDLGPQQRQSSSIKSIQQIQHSNPCPAISQPPECAPCSQILSQPLSPHLIVREYYWDSPDSNRDTPYAPCTSSEEQSFPVLDRQTLPPQYQNSWPQSQSEVQSRRFSNSEESPCPGLPTEHMEQSSQPPHMASPSTMPCPYIQPTQPCVQPPPPCMQPREPYLQPRQPCVQPPPPCMQPREPYLQPRPTCMQPPLPCKQPPLPCMQPPSLNVQPPLCYMPPQSPIQPQFSSGMSHSTIPQPFARQSPHIQEHSQPPFISSMRESPKNSMTSQRSPCQIQQRLPCSQKQPMSPPRPCIPEPPCTIPQSSPCQPSGQSIRKPPCMTPRPQSPCMNDRSSFTLPKPPCARTPCQQARKRDTRPPCFGSPDISSTSSPFDTEVPDAGTSRSFGPRVTRLGSLDDVPYSKTCGSQSPRPKRSKGSPDDDFEWTIRFPEDTEFWGSPCPRRRIRRSPERDGSFIKEKERKEEKMRCRCRERVLTKCVGRRVPGCCEDEALKHCSKCCGMHCPHPSYLFFK